MGRRTGPGSMIKDAAMLVTGALGVGLLAEALFLPGNRSYGSVLLAAAGTWAVLHARERDAKRREAVLRVFGMPESEVRSFLGLDEREITTLLSDGRARAVFADRISRASRATTAVGAGIVQEPEELGLAGGPPHDLAVDRSAADDRAEVHQLLHSLWSKASGPEYDKAEWLRLEELLRSLGALA
jgi:hypothetical protein